MIADASRPAVRPASTAPKAVRERADSDPPPVVRIPTLDRRLARALDPAGPRPDLRLKAVSERAAAGDPVAVLCAPVVPGLNDQPGALDRLAAAAAAAGAAGFDAEALLPSPAELVRRFPALEPELPDLVERYRRRWAATPQWPDAYRAGLADLVRRLRRRHGLAGPAPRRRDPGHGAQMSLF